MECINALSLEKGKLLVVYYWILFLIPVLLFFHPIKSDKDLTLVTRIIFVILGTLFIGLRYQVGGDWSQYLYYLYQTQNVSFLEAISIADPAYMAINWISSQMGFGIIGVNIICGLIFSSALVLLASKQSYPWLAIIISVPYLMIVVAMGYSRQAIGLAFVFIAIALMKTGHPIRYIVLVLIGALFHKATVVMLPFSIFLVREVRFATIILGAISVSIAGIVIVYDSIATYYESYALGLIQSSGGLIRILMNLVPITFAVFNLTKLRSAFNDDYFFWVGICSAAILCVPLVFIASTAVDRIALFLSPLQIVLINRVILVQQSNFLKSVFAIFFIAFYAAVLFVWLNYADNSYSWIPYKIHP